MNILIIGGTKFIGPYLVHGLVLLGHRVTVFHRGESESSLPESVRHVHSPDAAIPVLRFPAEVFTPRSDVVIHMIPMGERDAAAALEAFRGIKMVWISSGDVYRAYGRLTNIEPGPIEAMPLTEDSPLRSVLFPYREKAKSEDSLEYFYEKILMERVALSDERSPGVVLRLPKVYGSGSNDDLGTIYRFRNHPEWRWTHGYVENVAAAIVLAATHLQAIGIYNVGESYTPPIAERFQSLPPSDLPTDDSSPFNFAQDIVYDTRRIRDELGYREPVSYEEGIRRTLGAQNGKSPAKWQG